MRIPGGTPLGLLNIILKTSYIMIIMCMMCRAVGRCTEATVWHVVIVCRFDHALSIGKLLAACTLLYSCFGALQMCAVPTCVSYLVEHIITTDNDKTHGIRVMRVDNLSPSLHRCKPASGIFMSWRALSRHKSI